MKIIDNSIQLACALFPEVYASKKKYQSFHFTFIYERNKLISIGQNIIDIPNAKAIKFAKKFGTVEPYRSKFLHAEISALSKLYGKFHIDGRLKLVSLRLNKDMKLCNSKPCENCQIVLDAFGLNRVWYSNQEGKIENDYSPK